MKNITKFLCLLALAISFASCCDKDDDNDHLVTMHYHETKCSDKWMTGENSPEEAVKTALTDYMMDEYEIQLDEVELSFDANIGQDCEACSCLTGRIIEVSVDESFTDELESENFFVP